MKIKYPTRCQIVDVFDRGGRLDSKGRHWQYKTPEESKPHIGKFGLVEKYFAKEYGDTVRITLDDGNIIYGYECWWIPIRDKKK